MVQDVAGVLQEWCVVGNVHAQLQIGLLGLRLLHQCPDGAPDPREDLVYRPPHNEQDPAERHQDQQWDGDPVGDELCQQGGGQHAEDAARLAQRRHVVGLREATADVDEAQHAEKDQDPPHRRPWCHVHFSGMPHHPPGAVEEHSGDGNRQRAEHGGRGDSDGIPDPARKREPQAQGHDHTQQEHEETDTVASLPVLDVLFRPAKAAGHMPEPLGDAVPDCNDASSHQHQCAGALLLGGGPLGRCRLACRCRFARRRLLRRRSGSTGGRLLAGGLFGGRGTCSPRSCRGTGVPRWGRSAGRHALHPNPHRPEIAATHPR